MACKSVRFRDAQISKSVVERECAILSQLSHPNVVRQVDEQWRPNKVKIYMEYYEGGSLQDLINQRRHPKSSVPEPSIWSVFFQLASALVYCHLGLKIENDGRVSSDQGRIVDWKPILHRDIKPANIFLANDTLDELGSVKLGDFGLGYVLQDSNAPETYAGTSQYLAPEINRASAKAIHWTEHCDVFALGCTIYTLCTFEMPFQYHMEAEHDSYEPISDQYSVALRDLISSCMSFSPETRPSAYRLFQCCHPHIQLPSPMPRSDTKHGPSSTTQPEPRPGIPHAAQRGNDRQWKRKPKKVLMSFGEPERPNSGQGELSSSIIYTTHRKPENSGEDLNKTLSSIPHPDLANNGQSSVIHSTADELSHAKPYSLESEGATSPSPIPDTYLALSQRHHHQDSPTQRLQNPKSRDSTINNDHKILDASKDERVRPPGYMKHEQGLKKLSSNFPPFRVENIPHLHQAVILRDSRRLRAYIEAGGFVNTVDGDGFTALSLSVRLNEIYEVNILLEGGADPNIPEHRSGMTPLHWAAILDYPKIFRALLDAHADATAMNSHGKTPIDLASPGLLEATNFAPAKKPELSWENRALLRFQEFAEMQKTKVADDKAKQRQRENTVKLDDLRKFSEELVIPSPVPKDLIPILARGEVKQAELAAKDEENLTRALEKPKPPLVGLSGHATLLEDNTNLRPRQIKTIGSDLLRIPSYQELQERKSRIAEKLSDRPKGTTDESPEKFEKPQSSPWKQVTRKRNSGKKQNKRKPLGGF